MNLLISDYTVLELARIWAKETDEPVEAVFRLLARAVVAGELHPTYSDDPVVLVEHQDAKTGKTSIDQMFLEEIRRHLVMPGARAVPLSSLRVDQVKPFIDGYLEGAVAGDLDDFALGLRLVRIARADFQRWLGKSHIALPRFWFKSREGKHKVETQGRHTSWRERAELMLKARPHATISAIASEIQQDPKLNPKRSTAETIRRHLHGLGVSSPSGRSPRRKST